MREDPRYKALIDAEERYNNDPEMTRLVTEYNVQQTGADRSVCREGTG